MGLFSQYGTNSVNGDIVANESYSGVEGAYRIMSETHTNLCAINHAILEMDYVTASVEKGLLNESALEVVNEAAGSGIWAKVVEFIKKIGEKIVGLFKAAAAKIQGMCNKDGKDLCTKYEKIVYAKVNKGECSKMKFTWKATKNKAFDFLLSGKIGDEITDILASAQRQEKKAGVEYELSDKDKESIKPYDNDKITELKNSAYTAIVGSNTEKSDLAENMKEAFFEDEDEKEGLTSDIVSKVISILKENTKAVKEVNDAAKKANKDFTDKRKSAETIQKAMDKKLTGAKAGHATISSAYAHKVITLCNLQSTVISEVQTVWLGLVKENFKQARSILTRAAAWSQKKAYEEQASLMAGIQEASDMAVEDMFSFAE